MRHARVPGKGKDDERSRSIDAPGKTARKSLVGGNYVPNTETKGTELEKSAKQKD